MTAYCIDIIENGKINPVFIKANSALIKEYKEEIFSKINNNDKAKFLEKLWQDHYKATLIRSTDKTTFISDTWIKIQFLNQFEQIMFTLRWS